MCVFEQISSVLVAEKSKNDETNDAPEIDLETIVDHVQELDAAAIVVDLGRRCVPRFSSTTIPISND